MKEEGKKGWKRTIPLPFDPRFSGAKIEIYPIEDEKNDKIIIRKIGRGENLLVTNIIFPPCCIHIIARERNYFLQPVAPDPPDFLIRNFFPPYSSSTPRVSAGTPLPLAGIGWKGKSPISFPKEKLPGIFQIEFGTPLGRTNEIRIVTLYPHSSGNRFSLEPQRINSWPPVWGIPETKSEDKILKANGVPVLLQATQLEPPSLQEFFIEPYRDYVDRALQRASSATY